MRTYITTLLVATTLILASCGGGNDVASSRATAVSAAVSAAAPVTTTAASAPATTTPTTEAKVNGQVDERTGVAPVVAEFTTWSPTAKGGCANSTNLGGSGETLNTDQFNACSEALIAATTVNQCIALGGTCGQPYYACWGGWLASPGANCYAGTTSAN